LFFWRRFFFFSGEGLLLGFCVGGGFFSFVVGVFLFRSSLFLTQAPETILLHSLHADSGPLGEMSSPSFLAFFHFFSHRTDRRQRRRRLEAPRITFFPPRVSFPSSDEGGPSPQQQRSQTTTTASPPTFPLPCSLFHRGRVASHFSLFYNLRLLIVLGRTRQGDFLDGPFLVSLFFVFGVFVLILFGPPPRTRLNVVPFFSKLIAFRGGQFVFWYRFSPLLSLSE